MQTFWILFFYCNLIFYFGDIFKVKSCSALSRDKNRKFVMKLSYKTIVRTLYVVRKTHQLKVHSFPLSDIFLGKILMNSVLRKAAANKNSNCISGIWPEFFSWWLASWLTFFINYFAFNCFVGMQLRSQA